MANEISNTVKLSAAKGGATISFSVTAKADMTGTEMIANVQNFSTSDTQAISLGGCDQVHSLAIKNMDATNNLTVSLNATHTQVISVLLPGEAILLHGVSTTIYAKSSASTVDAFVACVEN